MPDIYPRRPVAPHVLHSRDEDCDACLLFWREWDDWWAMVSEGWLYGRGSRRPVVKQEVDEKYL